MVVQLTQEQKDAGWQVKKLGEIFEVKHGFAFKGENFSEDISLPIVVTPGNFAIGGGYKEAKPKNYVGEYPAEYQFGPGDFMVTMTDLSKMGDTLGNPAKVPADGRSYLHNQRIGKVIFHGNDVNTDFIFFRMMCSDYRQHVLSTASGSTVRHTSPNKIKEFEFLLPPLNEQKRVAEILGSMDDKIEANSRLLDSLSELAIAEVERLELFSEEPNSVLGDLITFSPKVPKPDSDTYQFIDMSVLPTTGPITGAISHKENWTGSKFEEGDTLFSRITPCLENGKTAIAMGLGDKPGIGSTEFIVMRALEAGKELLPYGIARNERFREIAIQKMTGTSGRQRVKWQDLASTPVNATRVSGFQLGKAEFELMRSFREENILLASIRNLLIRHLIR